MEKDYMDSFSGEVLTVLENLPCLRVSDMHNATEIQRLFRTSNLPGNYNKMSM